MVQRIPLAGGRGYALVDDEDVPLVSGYNWCICVVRNGPLTYARASVPGTKPQRWVYMHVLLTGRRGTDHRDGDGLNNTRNNLRPANNQQNHANERIGLTGTSRFKGVYWDSVTKKWRAGICVNYKSRHLGRFSSEEEAARAYDRAALEEWGEFARLNFP